MFFYAFCLGNTVKHIKQFIQNGMFAIKKIRQHSMIKVEIKITFYFFLCCTIFSCSGPFSCDSLTKIISASVGKMNIVLMENALNEEPEEDEYLKPKIDKLVEQITGDDETLIPLAIEMLKNVIKTAIATASVPKHFKYLVPYYDLLKKTHLKMETENVKKSLADILSVLSIGVARREKTDCLKYCLEGNTPIDEWGYGYIRHLEGEVIEEVTNSDLMPLIESIFKYNCKHYAEIEGCDFLMEVNKIPKLKIGITPNTFQKMCIYLMSCSKYCDDVANKTILDVISTEFLRFGDYWRSAITAMQLNDDILVNTVIDECQDKANLYQLAFICARNLYPVEIHPDRNEICSLDSILRNVFMNSYFQKLAEELDVLEPKTPENVYKIKFEILDHPWKLMSYCFVNSCINVGFSRDNFLTVKGGSKWIYRNKESMMSATASLGLLYLWDINAGLSFVDKYLYSNEVLIKAGALFAIGIINCRIRSEFDPALTLLGDYVEANNPHLQIGAILGLGIAYAGSARLDIIRLLKPIISSNICDLTAELRAVTSVAAGLISLGRCRCELEWIILDQLSFLGSKQFKKSSHMWLACFGVALCYFGLRKGEDVPRFSYFFDEPYRTVMQSMFAMCCFAGTGDVTVIQELMSIVGDDDELSDESETESPKPKLAEGRSKVKDSEDTYEWDYSIGQASAVLAIASISMGEELGAEMVPKIFGNIYKYKDTAIRKAVPLAIALTSVSKPQQSVISILTKYSRDLNVDVACNGIYGLGIVGAGTNNNNLAAILRQLAVEYRKTQSQLFMVKIAQGLIYLGKGTMTLNPLHSDGQLLDPVAMAGLLIPMVCLLEPHSLILRKSPHLLYMLAASIHPRWLLTLNENLEHVSVNVRVGPAVDVAARAGTHRTVVGTHTHSTPIVLATGERAELATDEYDCSAPTLDGICVLKKKTKAFVS